MRRNQKVVYTVRDVPESADTRIREVAEAEGVSLNTAVIRLLERGLGGEGAPVRRRDLQTAREETLSPSEVRAWRTALAEMDSVNPADWQ